MKKITQSDILIPGAVLTTHIIDINSQSWQEKFQQAKTAQAKILKQKSVSWRFPYA
jgi:hypothetical protein